ncbi:MAG: Spy/CpxP family protein refolding chaperone [Betaproteobacteria bacterium]|nr:Spy/CpxP family protein refolding chaperone [Betaproteobacteria bacterium]
MTEQRNPEPSPTSEGKRRGFFKRLGIAALIGGIASGAGFKVFAQGRPGGWHHRGGFMDGKMDPAMMDQRIEYMVKHLAVDIDATPEQTGKLVSIAKSAAGELRPLREKARAARKRGVELLAAQSIDRGAIESLRIEQIQAADAASRRLSVALGDIAEVLTPEQRTKLKQRIEKRFEHRGGMQHQQG